MTTSGVSKRSAVKMVNDEGEVKRNRKFIAKALGHENTRIAE